MTLELLAAVAVCFAFISSVVLVAIGGWYSSYQGIERPSTAERKTARVLMPVHERGFTMPELMVSVGIAAILTAIATPPLMSVIAAQRVKTATFDLYSAVSYARSEAIKRDAVVTIVPRNGAFTNGYDLVVGVTVLKNQGVSPGISISAPPNLILAFDGSGRLTTPARYQLELTSAQVSTTPKRCLVISVAGRPSIQVDNNHDGNCMNG